MASIPPLIRFILDRVEGEFRHLLAQHPDAPDLMEVLHYLDRARSDRVRLCFRFRNGTDWNSTIHLPPEFCRYHPLGIEDEFQGRNFFYACEVIWRRLRAEQPLHRELRETRIQYERHVVALLDQGSEREVGEFQRWYQARYREIEEELIKGSRPSSTSFSVDLASGPDMAAVHIYYEGDRFNRRRLYEGEWLEPAPHGPSLESEARGLALLKEWLSPAQRAEYEKHQHFEVRGGDTGARYRIRHGTQMNIEQLDEDSRRVCGWCFLPEGGLVAGDVMLAQKIALETDEKAALRVANRVAQMSDIIWEDVRRVRPEMFATIVA